jgi:hypothetical protein
MPDDNSKSSKNAEAGHPNDTNNNEAEKPAKEIGGRDGPEPTRYGDWEKNGRCVDF